MKQRQNRKPHPRTQKRALRKFDRMVKFASIAERAAKTLERIVKICQFIWPDCF